MDKYVVICEIAEPEMDVDHLVFYVKTLEDAKKSKKLLEGIDSNLYYGWVSKDDEKIGEVVEGLLDLGVWFKQEQMSYFIPAIIKADILENKPII